MRNVKLFSFKSKYIVDIGTEIHYTGRYKRYVYIHSHLYKQFPEKGGKCHDD